MYLTGIETAHNPAKVVALDVLIVPYWNWNGISRKETRRRPPVLIVPYWNWNKNLSWGTIRGVSVLIVPYWNWNLNQADSQRFQLCSNCTLLELKLRVIRALDSSIFCSNCTLLELKLWLEWLNWIKIHVLIVPYWNWNALSVETLETWSRVLIVPYWNWNIHAIQPHREISQVLIVPYWNWNKLRSCMSCFRS